MSGLGLPLRSGPRRAWSLVAVAALATALVAGCTPDDSDPAVAVSGSFGARPELVYDKPLAVEGSRTQVIWTGDGPVAAEGTTVLLNLYGQDGTDGAQVVDTFAELPRVHEVSVDSLGVGLHSAVLGQEAGARVLLVEKSDSTPVVLVADLIAGRAVGDAVDVPEGLPSVTLDDAGAPTVTLPDAEPPTGVVVQPLVRGVGNQVSPGQTVIVQYTAVAWSTGEVIDSSWPSGRTPFTTIVGDSRPVAAWDDGLIEQTVGSQVLIVAPPAWAYGGTASAWADETVVFVVDILYAGTLAAPEDSGTQDSDEGPGAGDTSTGQDE